MISNAVGSETSWSQYESWRMDSQQQRKLVEDFLIITVFSTSVREDVPGLLLAVGKRYPAKSTFASKLTTLLVSSWAQSRGEGRDVDLKSSGSPFTQRDFQRVGHLMGKLGDECQEGQERLLAAELKLCLRLHSENEILTPSTTLLPDETKLKRGSLAFVARNVKRTDAGNLCEFLHAFWEIVGRYDKLLHTCLAGPFSTNRNEAQKSGDDLVTKYSHVWGKGMMAMLWVKRITDLVREEFSIKRPNEKLKANMALLVQWIGEEVVPTLDAITGIDNSEEGRELALLVRKCLEPLDHSGNRNLLQRSTAFRSFYGIRPFVPGDLLHIVDTTLRL